MRSSRRTLGISRCCNWSMYWQTLPRRYLWHSRDMDQMLPLVLSHTCRLNNLCSRRYPWTSCTCLEHKLCTGWHPAEYSLRCRCSSPESRSLEGSTSSQDMLYTQRLRLASTYLRHNSSKLILLSHPLQLRSCLHRKECTRPLRSRPCSFLRHIVCTCHHSVQTCRRCRCSS